MPCNNANYLIHERILHIYRSCIHFSLRTDGQLRFTDGELVYHRYRPYRWTRFLGSTLRLAMLLTTSFTKGFCTFTDRVFISSSVPTDNFDLPMENWFTICTDRTDGQGFWGLPYALAIMLTTSFTKGFCTFTDRIFISPSVPTDNFDLPMENWFTIGTDRTDGQGFWGLPYALAIMLTTSFTKGFCTFTDRVFISPSRTDGQLRFTDGELVYHRYRPYRWTRFLGATLCPCNNANYLIHERILHIYRSCIHFSLRTDGQLRFTDGELVYHRYRPYRWTRFLGATLCPCNNANYLIHERILHIYRSCIHFSIRTDGQLRFTHGELVYHRYRPYRWTRFLGATLCPCNNANYLIHERILHIYRSCIHFSIRTDGQLRFTDGELVYHRYRPYRWTRFFGGYLMPLQ